MNRLENFRVVRQSGPDSRLVQRGDGTYWHQEIYRDERGRKCWRVAPVSEEVVYRTIPQEAPLHVRLAASEPRSFWRRLRARRGRA